MLALLFQNITSSKYYYQPSWVLIAIVLLIMILGYLYSAFNSRVNTFVKAVFISRFSAQASREERSLSHPVSLLLSLNFIFILSLFILKLISSGVIFKNQIDFSFLSFIILSITIFAIYTVKILFLRIFDFIVDRREKVSEYIFTVFLITQFLGILLLPIVIFIVYGPPKYIVAFTYVGFALIALAFITRVVKGISTVLIKKETTMFYIILYLCTLEILPILIGLKLITNWVR
jgi:hypothetical protein